VYDMFDDIILMSEGKLVYFGPAKDAALHYFEEAGWALPESRPSALLRGL